MAFSKPLDLSTLPLCGERLIEASAGTGKTFTIAALYLRLLLGLGGENAYPKPLSVEEILVVTFTEAATQELRGRIRKNIHQLRLACAHGGSADPLFSELLMQIADLSTAAALLLVAERSMDEAAIYTIHGFCQRVLTHNAFESGVMFRQTLLQDELPLQRQACADFWRRHCYPLPLAVAKAVERECAGPEALLAELAPYLHGDMPMLRHSTEQEESLESRYQQIITQIEHVKRQWCQAETCLTTLINTSDVDKRSYSKSHFPRWLRMVSQWAQAPTEDQQLPQDLWRFRQSVLRDKTYKGEAPQHALFNAIDNLLDADLTLRGLLLTRALGEVRAAIQKEKQQRAEWGFDDLLGLLDVALQSPQGVTLGQRIRQRYPVALIDEFQDTDPQQYRIFHTLYAGQSECGLLLIGDPKQAIYGFRGADIFTYLQARTAISGHYTLTTNWRSAHGMVHAVNQLFGRLPAPFVFEQIPFFPVQPATCNAGLAFELCGNFVAPLQFWCEQGESVTIGEYQHAMANQCAREIRDWLEASHRGVAWLVRDQQREPLAAADITVLVRNRVEAALIRDALNTRGIASVYFSNRDNVFSTLEAKDLFWLLQAVLAPEIENNLRCALGSSLFGLTAQQIEQFNQDQRAWDAVVNEFNQYRRHWLQRGVLPMLREVITRRHLAENILAQQGGERRLTDILHLGELLQEAAVLLESEHALIRWLVQQMTHPDRQADNQQLRLESDRHLVKIVTIHKAKGLEYPLVWLPFAGNFRLQRHALYHDRQNLRAVLDLQSSPQSLQLAEEERLAEDLRLLYVALTRAIYHCSVGVAPVVRGSGKKSVETDVHHSALGYLLQRGQAGDAELLRQSLTELSGPQIVINQIIDSDVRPWQAPDSPTKALYARQLQRTLTDGWRVSSYSSWMQEQTPIFTEMLPHFDWEVVGDRQHSTPEMLNAHVFPKGAQTGTFLHNVLEKLDFTQPINQDELLAALTSQGLASAWLSPLAEWLDDILHAPLQEGLSLSHITAENRLAELPFYLPIHTPLQAKQLDALTKRYDPISATCPALNFQQVHGMLKGFIDLIFCWRGRYYLLDYKSNWLGDDVQAYHETAIVQAMAAHRYDLQYQLYTLVLHRFLRHRLPDYDYQRHVGGVLYLFLRGLTKKHPGQGVFYCSPDRRLIEEMDSLFQGISTESTVA